MKKIIIKFVSLVMAFLFFLNATIDFSGIYLDGQKAFAAAPIIGNVSVTTDIDKISVIGTAMEPVSGLADAPYKYSIDNNTSEWLPANQGSNISSNVVNTAYDTSGNGGRKLVRLSNGWLICAVINGTTSVIFYRSTDNGATWSLLTTIPYTANAGIALCASGTIIYIVFASTSGSGLNFTKFDATSVGTLTYINPDSGQSSMGSGVSITIDGNGYLYAAWCSKNSTYPNSFNIRYSKSTNGGVSWDVPTQITRLNTMSADITNPCITVLGNNNPALVMQLGGSNSSNQIFCNPYSGSDWSSSNSGLGNLIYTGGVGYTQPNPCAVVDGNGAIHVVWQGYDSTDTSKYNIRYSKSTDNGATWSAQIKITSGNSYNQISPSTCTDNTGKLYVYWYGIDPAVSSSCYNIRHAVFNGSSWSSPETLTKNTTNNAQNPSLCSNITDFTSPPYIYQDQQAGSVKYSGQINISLIQSNVINAVYDTSGNGGRKLVRLSNGWLVSALKIDTGKGIQLSISKNNGASWDTLCYTSTSSNNQLAFALTSKGTTVYLLSMTSAWALKSYTIDALTQINVDITSTGVVVDSGQSNYEPNGVSIESDSSGVLHAAWSSKNNTYPNSFNIRYSKSSNGGEAWEEPTQITDNSLTGLDVISPSLVIANNKPVIIWRFYNSSITTYYIQSKYWDGTTWQWSSGGSGVVYNGGTYTQSVPCAVVDSTGIIHVVWQGYDSTETSKCNIRYSKSSDNGSTWSTPIKLTSGSIYNQLYPTITAGNTNNLYVYWQSIKPSVSSSYFNICRIIYNGSSWSTVETLTYNTTNNAQCPSLCSNVTGFVNPLCIYQDLQANAVKFTGQFNNQSASFEVTGLSPNTPYLVTFKARDKVENISTWSKTVYTNAKQPSLSLHNAIGDSITLKINEDGSDKPNPPDTKYQISCGERYVNQLGEITTEPTWIKVPDKTITITSLDSKADYFFKIKAINGDGIETGFSEVLTVTAGATQPSIPQNIKTQPKSNSITVVWDEVPGATSYDVEADGIVHNITDNLYFTHEGLNSETTHIYRVRARIGNDLIGDWSEEIVAETLKALPDTVQNLTAIQTSTTVQLNWNEISGGGVVYQVQADGKIIDTGFENSYLDQNLPVNSRHTYRVRAVNSAGAGPWSNAISITTEFIPPTTPTNIVGIGSKTKIVVTWDKIPDTTNYFIEIKCNDPNSAGSIIDNKANAYRVIYGNPESTYYIKVKAKNPAGESAWSDTATVCTYALETPVFLDIQESQHEAALNWAAVPGASTYKIERDGQEVGTTDKLTYTDTGLTAETKYSYRIKAISPETKESNWSYSAEAITLPEKPPVPQDFYASGAGGMVSLSWAPVEGAIAYDLEIDGVIIENGDSTSYLYKDVAPKTEHLYRVRARNSGIEGDWHPGIRLTTLPDTIQAPSNINVSTTNTVTTVKWENVPDAIKYEVEVDGMVVYSGTRNEYVHRRLDPNNEHVYRIRSIGYVETSDWSDRIVNNAVTLVCDKGKYAQIGLTASNVTDFSGYTLTVTYNPDVLTVDDLCTLTSDKELTIGKIKGTDVEIIQFEQGKIVFKVDKPIELGMSWSGIINRIGFKGKVTGGTTITYTVFIQPKTQ